MHTNGLSDGQEHHMVLSVESRNATHNSLRVTVDARCSKHFHYLNFVQMGGYFYLGGVETPERLPWTIVSRYGFLGYFSKYVMYTFT